MNRLGFFGLLASALVACSHPQPPAEPPLPPAEPAEPVASKPAPPPAPATPEPAATAPHDTEIPAVTTAVKLVSPGKGKRIALKLAPVAGARTPVELHIDFAATQNGENTPVPTLILHADAEATTVDKTGTQFKITVTSTDSHYATGVKRIAQLETGLAGLVGMTMTGTVAADGTAGKITMHHDAATVAAAGMMDLFDVTWMPMWPTLPAEPIAPGAKWQALSTYKLAGQIDVTETDDFELVAYKDKTWTIKGTAKLTGKEQQLEGAPVKEITGSGSMDATVVDGALIATVIGKRVASFSAVPPGQAPIKFLLELANNVGVDVAPSPSAPAGGPSPSK